MSITGIHGTTPSLPPPSSAADGAASAARTATRSTGETDPDNAALPTPSADKPAPLRFPWLSRLSSELGAAAKSPATFSAPVLGDILDKQA